MNFYDFLTITAILVLFLYIFKLLQDKGEKSKTDTDSIVKAYSDTVKEISTTFMEEIGKVQKAHFEQLEKQSSKQLVILEKQTKDFMGVMSDFIQASKPERELIRDTSMLDKILQTENSIEKEEIPEQNLEDIPRIPITQGVNVMFEGEEEIHPINIT